MNSRQSLDWTDERIERLKALFEDGLTGDEIGNRMGISRSAVLGKIHRLRLAGKKGPSKRKPAKRLDYWTPARIEELRRLAALNLNSIEIGEQMGRDASTIRRATRRFDIALTGHRAPTKRERRQARVAQHISSAPAESQLVSLIDAKEHHCRWPIDTDKGVMYCGAQITEGWPHDWCAYHREQGLQHKPMTPA